MPFQRKDVPVALAGVPIDRTQGERFDIGASGGLFCETVPGDGITIRIDDGVTEIPIRQGRSIDTPFRHLWITHPPTIASGTPLRLLTYEKGQSFFDATPARKVPAGQGSLFDYWWNHSEVMGARGVVAPPRLYSRGADYPRYDMWGTQTGLRAVLRDVPCVSFGAGGVAQRAEMAMPLTVPLRQLEPGVLDSPDYTDSATLRIRFKIAWGSMGAAVAVNNAAGVSLVPTNVLGSARLTQNGLGFGLLLWNGQIASAARVVGGGLHTENAQAVWPIANPALGFVPCELRITAATAFAHARAHVFVNGAQLWTRSFFEVDALAVPFLPRYDDYGPNVGNGWRLDIANDGPAGLPGLFIESLRVTLGPVPTTWEE